MIDVTDSGDVREVAFARPERANALTPDGLERLGAAIGGAPAPVVYLHGRGETFCAGADLDVVDSLDDPAAFARLGQQVADTIADADCVVVAGIDGAARGGGVELALACDLRVATPRATFAETGVALGLFGAWGGTVRLPDVVGLGDAMDLSLSARVVDAEDALRMGLVSRVVEDPREVAGEVAANDPDALAHLKTLLRADGDHDERLVARGLLERLAREADSFETLVRARHARNRKD